MCYLITVISQTSLSIHFQSYQTGWMLRLIIVCTRHKHNTVVFPIAGLNFYICSCLVELKSSSNIISYSNSPQELLFLLQKIIEMLQYGMTYNANISVYLDTLVDRPANLAQFEIPNKYIMFVHLMSFLYDQILMKIQAM